ncbi:MAG: ECF transporter S component [Clostridia bacterium]|nr:ECF transporter S component [Clostridia bacterium]
MKNSKVRFITRTAILLALVVSVQMIGRMLPPGVSNFIVGPLVNACLIVAAAFAGLWGGVLIAVLSPFTSLINNHAPIATVLLSFAPVIALGNAVLVVLFYLLKNKNQILGVAAGAITKFAVLFVGINIFLGVVTVKPQLAKTLGVLFGVAQLWTALLGGAVALLIIKALGKAIKE